MTRLAIRVQPGAKRAGLVGRMQDGTLKVAVTAPPEGGRANAAVAGLMAEALGLKPRQVSVVKGAASRSKTIEVDGLTPAEVNERLARALAAKERAKHGE